MLNSLEKALRPYVGLFHAGDGGDSSKFDRDGLIADLKGVITTNERYFQVAVGMAMVVFMIACWLVLLHRSEPKLLGAVFAASGISIGGAAFGMFKFWKQKVITETALILMRTMDGAELKAAAKKLLTSIQK